jgi:hypothetical protein
MAEQSIHYRTHCLFGVVLSKGAIKSMASKDFENLMDLLFKKGQRIEGFTTHLNGDSTGQAHISFIDSADTFSSKEPDVVKYTLHLRHTIDSDGNYELVAFKDIEQYYRDVDFLLNAEQPKLCQAYRDLAEARYAFDFDPDELIEEFLLSNNRKSKKFFKLKSEHFHIAAHCMIAAAHALQRYEQLKSQTPEFETYHYAIEKVYMKAFRSDPNFVKNYIQHKTMNDFNLVNFMTQVRAITQHTELMKTIYPKDGMPGNQGIQLLLDAYRRCAEACVKPLNLLRIGQEIAGGDPCPERTKGAGENRAILQPILGSILDCYDPRIRNSESHLSTEVDATDGQVLFYKDDKGQREFLVKYSFAELVNMTNMIQHYLFPALAFTAYMEWRTMLLIITSRSLEYKLALLKIGN